MYKQEYTQFKVTKLKIHDITVLPTAIVSLVINESISSPAITGYFQIADWQGFDEVGEIFAGDSFQLTFSTEDSTELNLDFTIYESIVNNDPNQTYSAITYSFCSPWLIDGMTRQISKSYIDKYCHEIIEDLLVQCGANIGYIEPTKHKFNHFTTPLWTPIHSITHLLTYALNKNEVGGYTLWTDLKENKVYCTTIDYLFKGKHGDLSKEPFTSTVQNETYRNRIESINIETGFDMIRYGNSGIASTRLDAFNFDKDKVYSTSEKITDLKSTHLSSKLPINPKFLDSKYQKIKGCALHPSTDYLIKDKSHEDFIKGKLITHYALLSSDIIKVNILSNPLSERRVGNLVSLKYPTQDTPKTDTVKQYSGKYVIKHMKHFIVGSNYRQAITLICDGYKESNSNLIKW